MEANHKLVLVIALNNYVTDKTNEELLIDGIENINDLAIKIIRVFETLSDNSQIVQDIKTNFSDVLSEVVQFVVYDIGAMYRYDVDFNLVYAPSTE